MACLIHFHLVRPVSRKCNCNPLAYWNVWQEFSNSVYIVVFLSLSVKNDLKWMPQYVPDEKSILVLFMAGCRQAANHHRSQCWLISMSPNGGIRPQSTITHWSKLHILKSMHLYRCNDSSSTTYKFWYTISKRLVYLAAFNLYNNIWIWLLATQKYD